MAAPMDSDAAFKEYLNKKFNSFDEFEKSLKLYEEATMTIFRLQRSQTIAQANRRLIKQDYIMPTRFKYTRAIYVCSHFGHSRERSRGIVKKPSRKSGCEASMTLAYKRMSNCLTVVCKQLKHNHLISADLYMQEYKVKRLSEAEKIEVKNMMAVLNPNNEQLAEMINLSFNKRFSTKDTRALRFQLKNFTPTVKTEPEIKEIPEPDEETHAELREVEDDDELDRLEVKMDLTDSSITGNDNDRCSADMEDTLTITTTPTETDSAQINEPSPVTSKPQRPHKPRSANSSTRSQAQSFSQFTSASVQRTLMSFHRVEHETRMRYIEKEHKTKMSILDLERQLMEKRLELVITEQQNASNNWVKVVYENSDSNAVEIAGDNKS